MANEKNTENAVRDLIRELGYYIEEEKGIISIEEQGTENLEFKKSLKNASKSGRGIGKPEFIIYSKEHTDFVIVIECKKDKKFHISQNMDKPKDYAVDGARHYAVHLSKNKKLNVIFIGISGTSKNSLEISTYLLVKASTTHKELLDKKGKPINRIIPFKDYLHYALYDAEIEKLKKEELINFSKKLHHYMRDYGKLSETEKPLIISGALLALNEDNAFSRNYKDYKQGTEFAEEFVSAIKRVIKKTVMPESKKEDMLNPYSFIKVHPELNKVLEDKKQTPLYTLVSDISEHIKPFVNVYTDYDVIGQFYGEFLRYTGGDKKGLGIVLTPRHITDLFCDLAGLTAKSVVLDICGGTGGFLISAMNAMLDKAKSPQDKENIRNNGLLGVEQMPNMFALLASNMILRGDGKANLYQGSCFEQSIIAKIKNKATVGMINPPYSQKGKDLHELNFIKQLLDLLKPNSIGLAIVPMSCAISAHPLKKEILQAHRLEAVISLPNDLFHGIAGTITCIMIFTAHIPHNENLRHKTWFAYCKDDGFVKTKNQGRIDGGSWKDIKEKWLSAYESKKEISGFSILKKVSENDEWCAEAYLETDYSSLTKEDFIDVVKNYIAFQFLNSEKV